jgi:hypothetical protein
METHNIMTVPQFQLEGRLAAQDALELASDGLAPAWAAADGEASWAPPRYGSDSLVTRPVSPSKVGHRLRLGGRAAGEAMPRGRWVRSASRAGLVVSLLAVCLLPVLAQGGDPLETAPTDAMLVDSVDGAAGLAGGAPGSIGGACTRAAVIPTRVRPPKGPGLAPNRRPRAGRPSILWARARRATHAPRASAPSAADPAPSSA